MTTIGSDHNRHIVQSSGVVLKLQQGGELSCRKYADHAFNHVHSCIYDNDMLFKPVYAKVLEGESKYIHFTSFNFAILYTG